ncbi:hypothetical protein LZ31DRAFT_248086 [Colletotrichum somersetense]|nr:hypothetical protein LZ31DRAFT_248086 [Colletotrichum somersetense]
MMGVMLSCTSHTHYYGSLAALLRLSLKTGSKGKVGSTPSVLGVPLGSILVYTLAGPGPCLGCFVPAIRTTNSTVIITLTPLPSGPPLSPLRPTLPDSLPLAKSVFPLQATPSSPATSIPLHSAGPRRPTHHTKSSLIPLPYSLPRSFFPSSLSVTASFSCSS